MLARGTKRGAFALAALAASTLGACGDDSDGGGGSRPAAEISTEAQTHDLQGAQVRLEVPSGLEARRAQNRLQWSGEVLGGRLEVEVTRAISGISEVSAMADRARRFFASQELLRDETTEGGGALTFREGGRIHAHSFRLFRAGPYECMASFQAEDALPDRARKLVEDACDSFALSGDVGTRVALAESGAAEDRRRIVPDAQAMQPSSQRLALEVEEGEGDRFEAVVGIDVGAPSRSAEGVRAEVDVASVDVGRIECDLMCDEGTGDEAGLRSAAGARLALIWSLDGQLQEITVVSGNPRNRLLTWLQDVLARSTASFPSEPVGSGARWAVVEPLDERILRRSSESPTRTRYRLVELAEEAATIERSQERSSEASSRSWRATARFGTGFFPEHVEGEHRAGIQLGESESTTSARWRTREPTEH